jgi:hypothetical protein
MIIQPIITNRFQFKDWVWDRNGHYISLSMAIIGKEIMTEVILTINEDDDKKINSNTKQYANDLLEDFERLDKEVDDFVNGTLLEIFDKNGRLRYTLMFFDPQ